MPTLKADHEHSVHTLSNLRVQDDDMHDPLISCWLALRAQARLFCLVRLQFFCGWLIATSCPIPLGLYMHCPMSITIAAPTTTSET